MQLELSKDADLVEQVWLLKQNQHAEAMKVWKALGNTMEHFKVPKGRNVVAGVLLSLSVEGDGKMPPLDQKDKRLERLLEMHRHFQDQVGLAIFLK